MKYKVGDKVKVKKLAQLKEKHHFVPDGNVCFAEAPPTRWRPMGEGMLRYCGQKVTIDDILETSGYYLIKEDNKGYLWEDWMFEGKVKEENEAREKPGPENTEGLKTKVRKELPQSHKKLSRACILLDALKVINGEHQDQYGDPKDSFNLIADFWSTYLSANAEDGHVVIVGAKDVAIMMTLFKLAREMHQHKKDNLVDACGYLALAADMEG